MGKDEKDEKIDPELLEQLMRGWVRGRWALILREKPKDSAHAWDKLVGDMADFWEITALDASRILRRLKGGLGA